MVRSAETHQLMFFSYGHVPSNIDNPVARLETITEKSIGFSWSITEDSRA